MSKLLDGNATYKKALKPVPENLPVQEYNQVKKRSSVKISGDLFSLFEGSIVFNKDEENR